MNRIASAAAVTLALTTALLATGCSEEVSSGSTASRTPTSTSAATKPSASPTPSADPGVAKVAASKDGVTVNRPVLKDTKDGFWVSVAVTNRDQQPTKYEAAIRLTGPSGYFAFLTVRIDAIRQGETKSQVYTMRDDSEGAVIPKNPTVTISEVIRTPA